MTRSATVREVTESPLTSNAEARAQVRRASRVQATRTGVGRNASKDRKTTWLHECSQFVTIRVSTGSSAWR